MAQLAILTLHIVQYLTELVAYSKTITRTRLARRLRYLHRLLQRNLQIICLHKISNYSLAQRNCSAVYFPQVFVSLFLDQKISSKLFFALNCTKLHVKLLQYCTLLAFYYRSLLQSWSILLV